jgi:hypothetical protein
MRYRGSYIQTGNTTLIARRGYGGVGDWAPGGAAATPIGHRNPQISGQLQHYMIPRKNGHGSLGAMDLPDWAVPVGIAVAGYFLLKKLK